MPLLSCLWEQTYRRLMMTTAQNSKYTSLCAERTSGKHSSTLRGVLGGGGNGKSSAQPLTGDADGSKFVFDYSVGSKTLY